MKVTTDGCLFGAIAANEISQHGTCKLLDIGTGTGLLSLMVAQQNKTILIDAIEIDEVAAKQAKENIAASAWAKRIQVIQDSVQNFKPTELYDIIICNPPFYEKQLSSPDAARRQAHHSSELTLQQLFQQAERLLKPEGKFFVIIPFYRNDETALLAKQSGFYLHQQWFIQQTPKHTWFRTVICFSQQKVMENPPVEICIKDADNNYSTAFTNLLQPFYLHL